MTTTTISSRRRACAAAALLALATAAAAAGCSSGTATPASGPASPPATESSDAAKARTAALTAYNKYREAQVAAMATSDVSGGDLRLYTADPLLTQIRVTLQQHREQGLVNTGEPSWSPRVTEVNVASRPHTAQIEDCFDNGTWSVVRKSTGESVSARGQSTRYLVVAKAVQYDDGRWLIQSAQAQRDRQC